MQDAGWLWLVTDVFAVVVLVAAMAYGLHMWHTRSRNPAVTAASNKATRRLYQSPDPKLPKRWE